MIFLKSILLGILLLMPILDPFQIKLGIIFLFLIYSSWRFSAGYIVKFDSIEWMLLLFGFFFLVKIFSQDIDGAISLAIDRSAFVLIYILTMRMLSESLDWSRAGVAYVAGCTVVAMYMIMSWAFSGTAGLSGARVSFDENVNANYIAYSLAMSLPVALSLVHFFEICDKRWLRRLMWAAISLVGMALILTGSRGANLGFFLSLMYFFAWRFAGSLLARVMLLFMFGSVLYFAFQALPDEFIARFMSREIGGVQDLSSGRFDQWQVAIDIIREHPILGGDLGVFSLTFYGYNSNQDIQLHNVFLNLLVELGGLGFTLYMMAVILIYKKMICVGRPLRHRRIALILFCIWIIIAFTGVWAYAVPAWFAFAWVLKTPANMDLLRD